jgi:predicted cobalt transporter CbtA
LRVGLLAGLAAAAAAVVFDLAIAERVVDRAVGLEAHRTGLAVPEPFSRTGQRGGLVVGELVLGAGVAFLLAGVATFLGSRARSARRFWLLSAAAAIWGVVLLPAVVYPPLPPGIPSALSIHERQGLYLGAVAVGIGGFAAAVHAWSAAPRFRVPLAICLALVPAGLAVAFLPDSRADTSALPSGLLTDFRIVSICSELVFWTATAVVGALLLGRLRDPVN